MRRVACVRGVSAVLLALAGACAARPAAATTPSLLWRGVTAVAVHCNIQDERRGYDAALTARLCERVRSLAAGGAPVTVRVAGFGDRALTAPDTVTLAVQGSTAGTAGDATLMFTVRPQRPSPDQPAELFGSTLRAAPLAGVDPAIEQALAEVLPWKAQPLGARPVP